MTLYINCCVRDDSRTDLIARELLTGLGSEYTELRLEDEDIHPLTEERLKIRNELINSGDYSDPMFRYAKQLAQADTIVISAPYWDLSFPSKLKVYIENIYVSGIVSCYGDDGRPIGLCKADKVYYVTTAGGPYVPDFSYFYIRELFTRYFGVGDAELIFAEGLDIYGNDSQSIVNKAVEDIHKRF